MSLQDARAIPRIPCRHSPRRLPRRHPEEWEGPQRSSCRRTSATTYSHTSKRHVGKDPAAQLFPAVHGCHLNDRVFRDYLAPSPERHWAAGYADPRPAPLRRDDGGACRQPPRDDAAAGTFHRQGVASCTRASPAAGPRQLRIRCPTWQVTTRYKKQEVGQRRPGSVSWYDAAQLKTGHEPGLSKKKPNSPLSMRRF